jgi:hypothetical protein
MAEEFPSDAAESSVSPEVPTSTRPDQEPVRIMVVGSQRAVQLVIHTLFRLGFAQVSEWSKLQIEPVTRKFMSVLTKYVRVE